MDTKELYNRIIIKSKQLDLSLSEYKLVGDKKIEHKYDHWLLHIEYKKENIRIFILFLDYNANQEPIKNFGGHISKGDNVEIDLDKFCKKNFGEDAIKKMSLNYYEGTIEEKIDQCLDFLRQVLTHPELVKTYTTDFWTKEYYKPWFEGTNF